MVRKGNKQFFIRDGILYHRSKVNGNKVEQLCLPQKRIETVLKIAHDLPTSGHQAIRRTNDRISFDCGTHFISELTKACLERLRVSPRFHCPYNSRAAGLVERNNATLKQIISKLAANMPCTWHKVLPFALWSLRTSVNKTLGMSPYQAVFERPAVGPLQLLSDDWTGKRSLPLDILDRS
jgi:hypothetical protein